MLFQVQQASSDLGPDVESEDVNIYAEAKVREMEAERPQSREQPTSVDSTTATPSTETLTGDQAPLSLVQTLKVRM